MKHKIIITESQYKKLMKNINEQSNWTPQLRMTSKAAPAWLSAIIGNKQDGFTIDLPPSTMPEDVNSIISDSEVEQYNNNKQLVAEVANKLGERNSTHFRVTMLQKNPKYRAMMLKVYSQLKANTDGNITIMYGRTKKTSETKPINEPGTDKPEVIEFPVDDNLMSKKYFVDNSWELDPEFIKQFRETTLKKIKDKMATLPKGKGILNGITIKTSCSTLPNGKSPDGKVYTFAELSELRNESAKNFVLKELQTIGVTISPKLKYGKDYLANDKSMGGLGNGSSSKSGDIWGQPGASKDRKIYEADKYLKISLDLNILDNDTTTTKPTYIPATNDFDYDYGAAFKVPDIPRRIPGIELAYVWNPKTESKCKVGDSKVSMECENWGSGPKNWSTNPKSKIYFGKEPN